MTGNGLGTDQGHGKAPGKLPAAARPQAATLQQQTIVGSTGIFVSAGHGFGATLGSALIAGAGSIHLHAPAAGEPEEFSRFQKEEVPQILKLLDKGGVHLSALVGGAKEDDWSAIAKVKETVGLAPSQWREERTEHYIQLLRLAKEMGCPSVNGHLGAFDELSEDERASFVQAISKICAEAEKLGVQFNVETGPEPAGELVKLFQEVNSPQFGANLDLANIVLYGTGDPYKDFETLLEFVRSFHVKDANYHPDEASRGTEWGTEVNPGEGDAEVEKVIKELVRRNLRIPLIVEREILNEKPEEKIAGMQGTLEQVRRWALEAILEQED